MSFSEEPEVFLSHSTRKKTHGPPEACVQRENSEQQEVRHTQGSSSSLHVLCQVNTWNTSLCSLTTQASDLLTCNLLLLWMVLLLAGTLQSVGQAECSSEMGHGSGENNPTNKRRVLFSFVLFFLSLINRVNVRQSTFESVLKSLLKKNYDELGCLPIFSWCSQEGFF